MAKIIKVEDAGFLETCDLEIDHPDHQFYLENGVLTSNSHSTAYSCISYQTAWLRYHYPTEFFTALLNSEDPNGDAAQGYISECENLNIRILNPDVNESKSLYTVSADKTIRTGLSAIKGVGETALEEIMRLQPFYSFEDFLNRTEARTVNKRVVQALAKAGAFDSFKITRKDCYNNYEKYRNNVRNQIKKGISIDKIVISRYDIDEWTRRELLMNEREVVGRTISGFMYEIFPGFFKKNDSMVTMLSEISSLEPKTKIKVEVIISSKIKEFKVKKPGPKLGKKFAKYAVEDVRGNKGELTVWVEDYEKYNLMLKDGIPIKAICKVDEYMETKSLSLVTLERVYGANV